MILITDKHLWEACGFALEQDIAELQSQPENHHFSKSFRAAMERMQRQADKGQIKKRPVPWCSPLFTRFLPAAAMLMLITLAGYRIMTLGLFRTGSSGPGYDNTVNEFALQETGPEDAATGAAEDTMPAFPKEEIPEMAADQSPAKDLPSEAATEEAVRDSGSEGAEAVPEDVIEEGVTDDNTTFEKESKKSSSVSLRSVAFDDSSNVLELEIQNNTNMTIILDKGWMLLDVSGNTVPIVTDDPDLANPFRLLPRHTDTIRCILTEGELLEGSYSLKLEDGENSMAFTYP